MSIRDLDDAGKFDRERRWIEQRREQRREQIEVVAPQVDARVKSWAEADPFSHVGEWRSGRRLVDTKPFRSGVGKPITAQELAQYTVVFSHNVDDEVFAFCDEHMTAFSTVVQSDARQQNPADWCPGCTTDPTWPPGMRDPAVVAAEQAAERAAKEQQINRIKASRKNRITKTAQIATARGVITNEQADLLLAIWQELQSPA